MMRVNMIFLVVWSVPLLASDVSKVFEIHDPSAPKVFMSVNEVAPGSVGLAIFQRATGKPYATYLDSNRRWRLRPHDL